jgi:hypothetical protein
MVFMRVHKPIFIFSTIRILPPLSACSMQADDGISKLKNLHGQDA